MAEKISAYWFIISCFAALVARYAMMTSFAWDWTLILAGGPSNKEQSQAAKDWLINERQKLRDVLLPPLFYSKNAFAMFGGIAFILSGFFWLKWYWPFLALPLFLLILPRLFIPLFKPSDRFKGRFMQGLEIKISAAKRFDTAFEVETLSEVRQDLERQKWEDYSAY